MSAEEIDRNLIAARFLTLTALEVSQSPDLPSFVIPVDIKSSHAHEIAGELVLRYLRSKRLIQTAECLSSETGNTMMSTKGDRWLRKELSLKSVSGMITALIRARSRIRKRVRKHATPAPPEKKRYVVIGPDKRNQVKMVKKAKTPPPPPRASLSLGPSQFVESPRKRPRPRPRPTPPPTPVKLEIESLGNFDLQEQIPMRTVIDVCVIEAKNLPRMDLIGTSDPFCVVGLVGDPKPRKTSVIEDSVTPVWNERFQFECPGETSLEVVIWDSDPLGTDQKMSSLLIPIRAESYEFDSWFEMHPETDVKINGSVRLAVKVSREEIIEEEPKPKPKRRLFLRKT